MKKRTSLKLLSLFILFTSLYSCGTKDIYSYKLSLDSSLYEYNQYDVFKKDDISVYENTYLNDELIESSLTDQYSIYLVKSEEEVEDGYVFSTSGLLSAKIVLDGYKDILFTFKVENSRSLSQKLIVNSYPTKTHYSLNEKFDSSGLNVSLYTEYYDSKSKKITRTDSIDNFDLFIDGEDASSYIYDEYGIKRANIKYQGYEGILSVYFSTFCLKDTYSLYEVSEKELMEEEDTTLSLTIENSEKEEGVLTPDEVNISYNLNKYSNTNSYIAQRYAPSIGKVPLLIIPIVIPGYEELATKDNYEVIKKAFYGSSNDLNFESLHSYYYKSSYGALDFRFTLTDYYYLDTDSSKFNTYASIVDTSSYEDTIYELSKDALSWAKNTYNLDLKDYDLDSNGAVDGIWMVYMAPYKTRGDTFWAFSGYGNETLNVDDPVANTYGWISYSFLKGEYSYDPSNNPDQGLDAHILIHETGHMLGIKDYYDTNKIDEESSIYDPLGSIDMMSSDLGDMNPYSKMMLGWTKPYVVYGSASLNIKSFQSKDNVIIIYDDTKTKDSFKKENDKYEINLFDEYLVLDYYTPQGLNELDYPSYNIKTVKDSGLRIYHVDNRLTKVNYDETNGYTFEILDDPSIVLDYSNKDLYKGITNTLNETISLIDDNGFDEIRWISSNNELLNYNSDNTNRIFKEGDVFSIESSDTQFKNNKFDNGNTFTYKVTVNEIK